MIDSLTAAESAGLIASWSIAVDSDPSGALTETDVAAAQDHARRSGGTVHYLDGQPQDAATLTLFVAGDAILLRSTVVRLLRSPEAAKRPIAARELPLGGFSCLLLPAGAQGTLLDSAADNTDVAHYREETAAVFRHRVIPGSTTGEGARAAGTLLELALSAPGLSVQRNGVARALSVSGEPLLSVVLRTQGHRPEALRDALLCLSGQQDGRFEVVVVVHGDDVATVASVVADQPEWLRIRTRVVTASGGTRALPLNVGIAAAKGTAVAFLDDDDLVLGDWVGAFHAGAAAAPGRLVRAIAGVQHVSRTPWNDGLEGHVVDSAVTLPYSPAFDLADHLRVNQTPFMALAFPAAFFALFGGADEDLHVCEDWDLLLRAASVLGVVQVPTVTAIYRRWNTGGDSYASHDSAVWARDMLRVRGKLDAGSLVLPPGSATELAELSALRAEPNELAAVYASTSWRISAPVRWLGARFGRAGRVV
ncbi:MAG: glycosyltransferase [Rhodoglobus sp.]